MSFLGSLGVPFLGSASLTEGSFCPANDCCPSWTLDLSAAISYSIRLSSQSSLGIFKKSIEDIYFLLYAKYWELRSKFLPGPASDSELSMLNCLITVYLKVEGWFSRSIVKDAMITPWWQITCSTCTLASWFWLWGDSAVVSASLFIYSYPSFESSIATSLVIGLEGSYFAACLTLNPVDVWIWTGSRQLNLELCSNEQKTYSATSCTSLSCL